MHVFGYNHLSSYKKMVSSIPLQVERRFSDPIRTESGCEILERRENRREKNLSQQLAEGHHHDPQERHPSLGPLLTGNGQALLPWVELIEQSRLAVDQDARQPTAFAQERCGSRRRSSSTGLRSDAARRKTRQPSPPRPNFLGALGHVLTVHCDASLYKMGFT
jgi:hypothetical protein